MRILQSIQLRQYAAMAASQHEQLITRTLSVNVQKLGLISPLPQSNDLLDELSFDLDKNSSDATDLLDAAEQIIHSDIPVAFPTETVYGLGADATRSAAVKGIYRAKQRPADNPLIVHFASLKQLRALLNISYVHGRSQNARLHASNGTTEDPIPRIYHPLISKFWPGPLTIILPNPPNSPLAPEVTAGLDTFGARIPRNVLALALIHFAGCPVAAPSANASTKPSPTAADHVAHDLDGRIETIVDGGPCDVGVESTVVDGLSQPPAILRPGGVSIEQLRACPGWENVQVGYKNVSESGGMPKAPGMKYRHYSPKAPVVLYESHNAAPDLLDLASRLGCNNKIGVVTTRRWTVDEVNPSTPIQRRSGIEQRSSQFANGTIKAGFAGMLETLHKIPTTNDAVHTYTMRTNESVVKLLEVKLGSQTSDIARGIFSALRILDGAGVDAIFVEGIDEALGETAAAVMNRLRKAAEVKI